MSAKYCLPSPRTFANSSPSSQPALLDHHHPVSPFLDPRSLLISCFPTEPYPLLHHVFGMTYHPNSASFFHFFLSPPPSLPVSRHASTCRLQDVFYDTLSLINTLRGVI